MAQSFAWVKCNSMTAGTVVKGEAGVETVMSFCNVGDRLKASRGSESAVTTRTRIGWVKFTECVKVVHGKRFSLRLKGKVYQICVQSAMLHGNAT